MGEFSHVKMSIKEIYLKRKKDLVGKAEIYALALVADDLESNPKITQTEIFKKIKKHTYLPLGPAGIAIYRNKKGEIPNKLDYKILVMESDQKVRDSGQGLRDLTASEEFKKIKGAAIKAAIAEPHLAIASIAIDTTFKLISKAFKMNQDDQLILIEGSFDKAFDDLGAKYGTHTEENKYLKINYVVEIT